MCQSLTLLCIIYNHWQSAVCWCQVCFKNSGAVRWQLGRAVVGVEIVLAIAFVKIVVWCLSPVSGVEGGWVKCVCVGRGGVKCVWGGVSKSVFYAQSTSTVISASGRCVGMKGRGHHGLGTLTV